MLVSDRQDRQIIHDVIYKELCLCIVNHRSKSHYLRIIESLAQQGAKAMILGCTEISMLVNQSDTAVRLMDTTHIHAQKAVDWALSVA
jgi:aspartate racemase